MDPEDLYCLRYKRLKRALWWNIERSVRRACNWSILAVFVGASLIIAPSIWLVLLWAVILARLAYVASQLFFSLRARKRYGLPSFYSRNA
jgi:hypothetical protein